VEALVKNLNGEISLSNSAPGTVVTISDRDTSGLQTDISSAA